MSHFQTGSRYNLVSRLTERLITEENAKTLKLKTSDFEGWQKNCTAGGRKNK